MDKYWENYDNCLDKLITSAGGSVDGVINTLNEHYPPSSGEAFFPGGADRDLLGTLMERGGWTVQWMEASYYFALIDTDGNGLTYVEGDVYRGTKR